MALGQGFHFLITTFFSLLTYVLTFRFLFNYLSRNYRNSVYMEICRVSEPMIKPLRILLPTIKGVDTALLAVIYLIHLLRFIIIFILFIGGLLPMTYVFIAPLYMIIQQSLNLVFFSIIILVISSWLGPYARHPIVDVAYYLSDWLVRPIRERMPPLGGFDLSPMVAIIGIQFINIVFASSFPI